MVVSGSQTTNLDSSLLPVAINDSGEIGGSRAALDYKAFNGYGGHAVLYQNGQITDLSAKYNLNDYSDVVRALNNSGSALISEAPIGGVGQTQYLLYNAATGTMTDLNDLAGGAGKVALGLNGKGQAVGNGFLYQAGQFIPLPSLIPDGSSWSDLNATAINDAGQIVGQGLINGQEHAFLMTLQASTVPEPSTLAVFGVLAALGTLRSHAGRSRK